MKKLIPIIALAGLLPILGPCEPLPPVSVYFEQYRAGNITLDGLKECVEMRESVREMHDLTVRDDITLKNGASQP